MQIFAYRFDNWPISEEVKPLLEKMVLDSLEIEKDLLYLVQEKTIYPDGSCLNKFTRNQQIKLIEKILCFLKPEAEIPSNYIDYHLIFEELLYNIVTSRIECSRDDLEFSEDEWLDWKEVAQLSLEWDAPKLTDEQAYDFLLENIWWNQDWDILRPNEEVIKNLKKELAI